MDLQTPIINASRAYKMYAKRLSILGIEKIEDFLFHIPFRYEDFSLISKIGEIQAGETVTIKGKIEEIKTQYTRRWKNLQRATLSDSTGSINLLWFNQPYLVKTIKKGDILSVSGKVTLDKNKPEIVSPDYEVIYNNITIHTGRLVPIYSETKGISSKWLRRQIYKIISEINFINDYLPQEIIKKEKLLTLNQAIRLIHFPENLNDAEKAKERLSFDELFILHLSSMIRKINWQSKKIKPFKLKKEENENFIKRIEFELTNSQKTAVSEILNDLEKSTPMNRLLQGDVGSGKTIVAAIASHAIILEKSQVALMAPTEILANQHYKTISKLFEKENIKISLATGSSKINTDNFDIIIGTHALIDKKIKFTNLGLIIIDEQQRFGVEQRSILRNKNNNAHLLTMTATPIPRTVALTMYGELDLSILTEMPKGRIKIKTWLVPEEKRNSAYSWISEKIEKNHDQVFIVCPFIEESESMATVKAAVKEFERLKNEIFSNLKLGLLHGKMKTKEKDEILKSFRDKKIDILVSTPVVEVGIDIPNATIMVIEEAERFGLAQLHQLRGRVGRGIKESYCLLFTNSKSPNVLKKLKALETLYSGTELAELDLKLRGPGEIYGTSQHGVANLKIANFSNLELIQKTKAAAMEILPLINNYPELKKSIDTINSKNISPD